MQYPWCLCPKDSVCHKCKWKGHFSAQCLSKRVSGVQPDESYVDTAHCLGILCLDNTALLVVVTSGYTLKSSLQHVRLLMHVLVYDVLLLLRQSTLTYTTACMQTTKKAVKCKQSALSIFLYKPYTHSNEHLTVLTRAGPFGCVQVYAALPSIVSYPC